MRLTTKTTTRGGPQIKLKKQKRAIEKAPRKTAKSENCAKPTKKSIKVKRPISNRSSIGLKTTMDTWILYPIAPNPITFHPLKTPFISRVNGMFGTP